MTIIRYTKEEIKKRPRPAEVDMTDEEVHAAALSDPDCQPISEAQLSRGRRLGMSPIQYMKLRSQARTQTQDGMKSMLNRLSDR